MYLLEKLKGERTPDESLAAHPNAFLGCSCSSDFTIFSLQTSDTNRLIAEWEFVWGTDCESSNLQVALWDFMHVYVKMMWQQVWCWADASGEQMTEGIFLCWPENFLAKVHGSLRSAFKISCILYKKLDSFKMRCSF